MKKAIFHLMVWLIAFSALGVASIHSGFWATSTALAVGDFTIDWGVPTGDPIFVVNDAKPGDIEAREVSVTNNASFVRTVGVRSSVTTNTGIGDVLDLVIKVDGIDVYGGESGTGTKTLSEFFVDSSGLEGFSLTELSSDQTKIITFDVFFNNQVGNTFQQRTVVFDVTLGVTGKQSEVPEECAGMEFDGEPIFGSEGSDSIRGTSGNDLIFGLEGTDSIRGLGGDDCIVGGPNTDVLRGNGGNDVLLGGEGTDSLYGGRGNDELYGGDGVDSLKGGRGDDRLYGGGGGDSLKGYGGEDYLDGGDGDDSLKGGRDNDELVGGAGVDVAKGQGGIDRCEAEVEKSCEL